MGFCVARTTKGAGSLWVIPSMVTCFSSMASSKAAWVFGGARLISSARRMLANNGPARSLNSPDFWSYMYVPMMSKGSKSGVNWTRLNLHPRARAKVLASSVLAKPGKSSNNMLPLERIPTVTRRKFSFFPMITLPTSFMRLFDIAETVAMRSWVLAAPAPACALASIFIPQ